MTYRESRERVSTTCGSAWVNGDATQAERLTHPLPQVVLTRSRDSRYVIVFNRIYEILYLEKERSSGASLAALLCLKDNLPGTNRELRPEVLVKNCHIRPLPHFERST